MAETVALYLNASAREVWLVGEDGAIALHGPEGRRTASVFPITPPAILS
jgi:hypothetical protein